MSNINTILIVEDSESTMILIRRILEQHSYTVLDAKNISGALELLKQADFLLLDLKLDHEDGRDLLRKMKEQNIIVPITVLTGAGPVSVEELYALGVSKIVEKPVDFDTFTESVLRSVNVSESFNLGTVCINSMHFSGMVDKCILTMDECTKIKTGRCPLIIGDYTKVKTDSDPNLNKIN